MAAEKDVWLRRVTAYNIDVVDGHIEQVDQYTGPHAKAGTEAFILVRLSEEDLGHSLGEKARCCARRFHNQLGRL